MSQFQIQDQLYSKKKRWLQFLKPGIEFGEILIGIDKKTFSNSKFS